LIRNAQRNPKSKLQFVYLKVGKISYLCFAPPVSFFFLIRYVVLQARKAIQNHPTELGSPSHASKLRGIGPTIVAKLEQMLAKNSQTKPVENEQSRRPAYIPRHRTGAYAILLALCNGGLNKEQLIEQAKIRCDGSVWTGMNTLLKKGYVKAIGSPPTYRLTDSGASVAKMLEQEIKIQELQDDDTVTPSFPSIIPNTFVPGTFDIRLVVDSREAHVIAGLRERGIEVDVRKLELGDMLWVAQRKDSDDELVLDCIVERKRMDDLVDSIKDDRFREQKARLSRSGISRVIYIFEEYNVGQFNQKSIQTAISTTQTIDGFLAKRTLSTNHTVDVLVQLHGLMDAIYNNQTLYGIPDEHIHRATFLELKAHLTAPHLVSYKAFSDLNSKSKNVTLGELFVKMLMTTQGISYKRASEIASFYRTPHRLISAYRALESEELKMSMVDHAIKSRGGCTIGPVASAKLCGTWCL
jgi:ERCC4-type nuclease